MKEKEEDRYVVYWYHLASHKDIYTQGYIGITGREAKRKMEHLTWAKTKVTHFTNAVNKYGKENILYEVLHEQLSKTMALDLEYKYRPDNNIGWNMAVGGVDTLSSISSTRIQLYHKDNYIKLLTFESIEEACRETGANYGSVQQMHHRKSMLYNSDGWAVCHEPMQDRSATLTMAENRSIKLSGIKRGPSPMKGKKKWTNEQKRVIGDFHRGKTITEEQKAIVSQKNRANSPQCSPIELNHRDSDIIHKFHSISEASRQLNIPLSRLKSKVQRTLNNFGKDGWRVVSYTSKKNK